MTHPPIPTPEPVNESWTMPSMFYIFFSDWPRDRLPKGIPLIQILFAITLDFLQIYKSEKLKVQFQHLRK